MNIEIYIKLNNKYIKVPSGAIYTDKENNVCHYGCPSDIFYNILSENILELDDDGLTIITKWLGDLVDETNEDEWEEWNDNNKVGEILSETDDWVWWDSSYGKLKITNDNYENISV